MGAAVALHGRLALGLQRVPEVVARVRGAAATTSTMPRLTVGGKLCEALCPVSSALPLLWPMKPTPKLICSGLTPVLQSCVELTPALQSCVDWLQTRRLGGGCPAAPDVPWVATNATRP